ncbi:MAG: AAA family ATPase [Acidimicrobiia bacterium]
MPADRADATAGSHAVLGRAGELAAVEELLLQAVSGPASLGLVGPAGIGKTALLEAALAAATARRFRLVVVRAVGAEARVANAGLRDVLHQLDGSFIDHLPSPQRRALRAAVAEADPADTASHLAVLAAVQAVLARAAADGPLLIAVDDLHWLDASSAAALRFAHRRLSGPVGMVWTRRQLADAPTGPEDLGDPGAQLTVGALADAPLRVMLQRRAPRDLDRSVVDRIVGLAGGNPFVALQLAAAVEDRAMPAPPPLPPSVDALVSTRLAKLPAATRDVLLVAAASAAPTVAMLEAAMARPGAQPGLVSAALAVGEDAGIVHLVEGVVTFTHPLMRHGISTAAEPSRRRDAHRRLAALVAEPEERARHLALAALGPEPAVLDALDRAAGTAARRGAPGEAAELLELGIALGPLTAAADGARRVAAAGHRLAAGDLRRARELLDVVLADADPAGRPSAHALGLRAAVALVEGDLAGAAVGFERAVAAATDARTRVWGGLFLSFLLTNTSRVPEARQVIDEAERLAEATPGLEAALVAAAMATSVMVRFLAGAPIDWARLEAAVALEQPAPAALVPTTSRPLLVKAILLHLAGRLPEASASCELLREQLRDEGDEAALALVDFWVTSIWCSLGRFEAAEAHAAEAGERAAVVASPFTSGVACSAAATVAAWRGEVDRCRAEADAAVVALGVGSPLSVWPIVAAGMIELSRGDLAAASLRYEPLFDITAAMGLHQGAAVWWTPELIEVLAGLGRVDEARALLDRYDVAQFGDQPSDAVAVAMRCAGLVAAAEGALEQAEASLRGALAAHLGGAGSLAVARTQLHLGALLRRRGRRRDARDVLERALATFDGVGSRCWAERVRHELAVLGLRPRPDDDLTPTERRVAGLLAEGLTNREVAGALHASPKTVEVHITRIYRKLGLRGRAELIAHVARHPERFRPVPGSPSP